MCASNTLNMWSMSIISVTYSDWLLLPVHFPHVSWILLRDQ